MVDSTVAEMHGQTMTILSDMNPKREVVICFPDIRCHRKMQNATYDIPPMNNNMFERQCVPFRNEKISCETILRRQRLL